MESGLESKVYQSQRTKTLEVLDIIVVDKDWGSCAL